MTTKRRADFEENRIKILEAAHDVFMERGVGAPLDMIAKQAGIGRATFFRHFPERRALINEMMDQFLDKLGHTSDEMPVTDDSLFDVSRYFFDQMIHYAPVADYLRAQGRDDPALVHAMERFSEILGPHVKAAIAAGNVRQDLLAADVVISAVMLSAAATTPHINPEGMRKAYETVMQGLKST